MLYTDVPSSRLQCSICSAQPMQIQQHSEVTQDFPSGKGTLTSTLVVVLQHQSLNHVCLFGTPRTVACQAPLSLGFSRQENWRGLPCPPSADLPDAGMEAVFLTSPALAYRFFTTSTTWEALHIVTYIFRFFSMISYYKMLNIAPVLYSKSQLFICFTYSSLYLLIPHSQFIPPQLPLWLTIHLFCVCEPICFGKRFICIIFQISRINDIIYFFSQTYDRPQNYFLNKVLALSYYYYYLATLQGLCDFSSLTGD